jgi:hypothetical protein
MFRPLAVFDLRQFMRKSECLGRAAAAAVDTCRGNPGSDPALGSEIMAIQVVIRLSALKLWQ